MAKRARANLTKEDLKAIGTIVGQQIKKTVKPMIDEAVGELAIATNNAIQHEVATLRSEMATKEDLKQFATKEDLKKFATKDDLKQFATKEDLKSLASKHDLQDAVTDIKDEFRAASQNHETRITKLEERV